MLAGMTVVYAGYDVDDRGSTASTPATGGAPVPVGRERRSAHGGAGADLVLCAAGDAARDVWVGLSLTSPWGLGVEYDDDWFGRYDSIETRLTTINVSPALAYRITEWLSIGGGLNVEYADAKLTSALPDTLAPGGPSPAPTVRPSSPATASPSASMSACCSSRGPHPHRRALPLGNRAPPARQLQGAQSQRRARPGQRPDGCQCQAQRAGCRRDRYRPRGCPGTTLFAEAQWFNWSRFNELRVKFSDGRADSVRKQEWKEPGHSTAASSRGCSRTGPCVAAPATSRPLRSMRSATPRCPTAIGCASASASAMTGRTSCGSISATPTSSPKGRTSTSPRPSSRARRRGHHHHPRPGEPVHQRFRRAGALPVLEGHERP